MRVAAIIASALAMAIVLAGPAEANYAAGARARPSGLPPPAMPSPPASSPPAPAEVRPENTDPPAISGDLREGEYIFTSTGSWVGSPPPRYAIGWQRCDATSCSPTGVTGFIYLLGKAEVGKRMRAVVTASNAAGSTVAYSTQSELVRPTVEPERQYERMSPFPRIAIGGFITGKGVRLSQLSVRAPSGAGLGLTCRGSDCPYRRVTGRVRRGFLIPRGLLGRTLRAGTVIELRVTQRNKIGKFTRFRIRGGRKPARMDRCLVPGERRPSHCRS